MRIEERTADGLEPKPGEGGGVLPTIAEAFLQARQDRLPKVAQLYKALIDLIATGRLTDGDKLPGERELCGALGISLGTAQKSLAQLALEGQIVREHGRGTFVQARSHPLHELWHYRFRDALTGDLLPVYARLLDRSLIDGDGPWVEALGADEAGYVEVVRLIDVAGRFACWSTMRFGASRFGRLLDLPRSAIESVNLKALLFEQFDAPTIAVRQSVRVAPVGGGVAKLIGRAEHTACLNLSVTALSRWSTPISHQTIVVPPVEEAMELASEPAGTEAARPNGTRRG